MRKSFSAIFVIILLLCGCSVQPTPAPSATPSPAAQSTAASIAPLATNTILPTVLPSITLSPSSTETDRPYIKVDANGFPSNLDKKINTGQRLGIMAAANASFLYSFKLESVIKGQYVYSHDELYKQSRKTGKSAVIRKLEIDKYIRQIFLDINGGLYYLSDFTLNKYEADTDREILSACDVIRVDADAIYINGDGVERYDIKTGNISPVANVKAEATLQVRPLSFYSQTDSPDASSPGMEIYSLDLESGKICDLMHTTGGYLLSDEGNCLVVYEETAKGMKFDIYDYRDIKKYTCIYNAKINKVDYALVKDGKLYITDDNDNEGLSDIDRSNVYIFDIQAGKLLSKKSTDYIFDTFYYQDKWFLYTFIEKVSDEHNDEICNQKVRILDPQTNMITEIAHFGDSGFDDDQSYTFEVCGGYLYMIGIYDVTSMYYCWEKCDLAELLAAAFSSPTPSPSPTPEPTHEPMPTATATDAT